MKTARGIYLDLYFSDYVYEFRDLKFYFSSLSYLNKFKEGLEEYITNECIKFYSKYQVLVDLDIMLAIKYYEKIEKRGFRVYYKDNIISNVALYFKTELDIGVD